MQAGRLPVPLAQVKESRPLVYWFLGQPVQFLPVYHRSCASLIFLFSTLIFLSYSSFCWHGWLLLVQPIPPDHRWQQASRKTHNNVDIFLLNKSLGGSEFEPLPHHLGLSLTFFIIGNWLHHSADVQVGRELRLYAQL